MGWLEGVLTGYAGRHYEIEKQKREAAAQAAEREERVFSTLLNSPYKDIREFAGAGILDLANPKKRKGGVAGWMGEMEGSPYLDAVRRTQTRLDEEPGYAQENQVKPYYPWLNQDEEQGGAPPTTPSIPTPAGSIPAGSPGAPGSAAQPSTSLVEGGPTTQPTPAPPPPAWSGVTSPTFTSPSGVQPAPRPQGMAGPPPPMAGAPQAAGQAGPGMGSVPPPSLLGPPLPVSEPPPAPPGAVSAGLPGATTRSVGRRPPPRASRTQLPGIFPTASDLQRDQSRSVISGKIEGYADMYRAQGFSEQEAYAKAADLLERDLISSGGSNPYMSIRGEYTNPATGEVVRTPVTFDKSTASYRLPDGRPAPPDLRIVTAGRLSQPIETAAQEMGFPSATAVPAARFPELLARAQQLDASFTQNRTEAGAMGRAQGPLDPKLTIEQHLPMGTEGRQLTGQTLPTPEERTRKLATQNIRGQVEEIRGLIPQALVSETTLAGLAPNAANALRARTTKRNEFAMLSAKVNAVVNVLARAVQEQRGAQTENDALRAYQTLVMFESGLGTMLKDPLGGDTVESADRRIAETLASLDQVLARLPGEPTVQPLPTPGGAPAAPPPRQDAAPPAVSPNPNVPQKGFYKDLLTGKRYYDGKEY